HCQGGPGFLTWKPPMRFRCAAASTSRRRDSDMQKVALLAVALLCVSFANSSDILARDNGRFAGADPEIKAWFDKLASGRGPCCSDADGYAVSDPDWESKAGHYRVRIDGQWIDVPDDAVITVPNRVGRTMVWPIRYPGPVIFIR